MCSYLDRLFGLHGKMAVVVGGTSGLGAAAATALAACGASVVVAGRDETRGSRLVEDISQRGGVASFEFVDVLDEISISALAEKCVSKLERIDILLNAAGVFSNGDTLELATDDWRRVLDINVTGTFLSCREFGKHMVRQGSGRIINFASTDAVVGVAGEAAYCASKGAVLQLTRALAAEWVKHGVNVNAVGPTDFRTPMIEALVQDPEYTAWAETAIPKGRYGEPDELVAALLYLASPASEMVVGHCLMVDGGRTII